MAEEESSGSLPAGTLVGGRFKTERLIGRGGMGEVYAARHATTGKEVALKLILATAGSSKEHVRRFLREARAATAINHPNVIEVFDVFEDDDGTPVMVMELLRGESYAAYRKRNEAQELHAVARILLPVARALRAAHSKGIVHRDLKPDNIFLADTASGPVTKLLDFGIAKILGSANLGSETQGQTTNTGSILGTPHYMSFEQAMSDKGIDHRTDIWAMGVMIFESLTGRRPLTYDTLGQMYACFLQGTVPSIRQLIPDLPVDAADVIDLCLVKDRETRLGEIDPLISVLAKYSEPSVHGARAGGRVVVTPVAAAQGETLAPAMTSEAPETHRTRRVLLPAIIAGALLLVGAAFVARGALRPKPSSSEGVVTLAPLPASSPLQDEAAASAAPTAAHALPAIDSGTTTTPSSIAVSVPQRRVRAVLPLEKPPTPAAAEPTATKKGIPDKLPY